MSEVKDLTRLRMACRCGPDARKYWDDQRAYVEEKLGLTEEHKKNFVTLLIHDLWWEYMTTVEWIGCDQWLGIKVEQILPDIKLDPNDPDTEFGTRRIRVECDTVEDGLVAIWLHLQGGRAA